jgi:hypothetical protein
MIFRGTTKEEHLGNDCFKYVKFIVNIREVALKTFAFKVVNSVTNESLMIYEGLEAFQKYKTQFI